MPNGKMPWQWIAERMIVLIGSVVSAVVLVFMLYLNAKFEGHHLERQSQYLFITQQLSRYDKLTEHQQAVIVSLQIATERLNSSLDGLRRDIARMEGWRDKEQGR